MSNGTIMNLKKIIILPLLLLALVILQSCSENLADKNINDLLNRGCELAKNNDWQQALKYAQEAVKREPANAGALILLALAYENSGDLEQALQTARLAVKADAKYFQAQYTLGRLCLQDPAKIQDSIEPLKRALRLNPGDTDTLVLLAQGSKKLGLLETVKYFEQLAKSKRYQGRPEPWNEMMIIYAEQNNTRDAARCLVTAYSRAKDNPIIVLNFALFWDYYANPKRPVQAVKYYRKFLTIVANNSAFDSKVVQIKKRINEILGTK
jgi:tetratricopeptide (TPR) repeat protein